MNNEENLFDWLEPDYVGSDDWSSLEELFKPEPQPEPRKREQKYVMNKKGKIVLKWVNV